MLIQIPGQNCWKISNAKAFSVLIDAQSYFRAFQEAASRARNSIFILSWDIDSRLVLDPEASPDAQETLLHFFSRILEKNPRLNIYILTWDYAPIYYFERQSRWRLRKEFDFSVETSATST